MKRIIFYLVLFSTCAVYGQNFKQVFKKYDVEGSTTIYNPNKRTWLYTDSLDATRQSLPGATFNIINSSIALETGALKTENEPIKWDGKKNSWYGQKMQDWDKDTDMKTAFKNSNNWFYSEVAKKIGRKDYQEFLKACNYGNLNFSEKNADFWNNGQFAVSPVGQVNFLRVFSREQFPFSPRTFRIVKELMIAEKTDTYAILDKTGLIKSDGQEVSWYIGYIEMKDKTFYFATRITKPVNKNNPAFAKAAKEITMNILKQIKAIN